MERDFTLSIYRQLLEAILQSGYQTSSYEEFVQTNGASKTFVLRHDVDRMPQNAVAMAEVQHQMGIKATYYWRVVSESYDARKIEKVVSLGHELGFHYEDLTLARGDYSRAIELFEENLEKFRQFYPVSTICMHGSPLTKWDNRSIWDQYDYRDYNIIAEPYFDTDFNKVYYMTDTGRSWNNSSISVRDKVDSGFDIEISSTQDLIEKLKGQQLPDLLMHNVHPNRWNDQIPLWMRELIMQNVKNVIKKAIFVHR